MRQRAPQILTAATPLIAAVWRTCVESSGNTATRMQLTRLSQAFKIKACTSALDPKRASVAQNHAIALEMILHYFRPPFFSRFGMTWVVAFSGDSLNANQPVVLALFTGPMWSRCVDALSSSVLPEAQINKCSFRCYVKHGKNSRWKINLCIFEI